MGQINTNNYPTVDSLADADLLIVENAIHGTGTTTPKQLRENAIGTDPLQTTAQTVTGAINEIFEMATDVEANTGFPVTELKKLKVGNVVYDTDGTKNYSVSNVANNNITVSVLNSNQFVQEVIAINTGNHTGSSSAWNLVLTDGMNPVSVALKNADGSPFADDIHENELLFVYVDTAGNVARVLEIHSHDLEILKDTIITEKTVSGNPITVTDALPYNAVSLSVEIEAEQDLHGYDKPWVGGAGKNKCNATETSVEVPASGNQSKKVGTIVLSSTTSIILSWNQSKTIASTTSSRNVMHVYGNGKNYYPPDFASPTFTEGYHEGTIENLPAGTYDVMLWTNNLSEGYTASQFMVRDASISDNTYAPYANICPISGHTSVTISQEAEE